MFEELTINVQLISSQVLWNLKLKFQYAHLGRQLFHIFKRDMHSFAKVIGLCLTATSQFYYCFSDVFHDKGLQES